MTAPTPCLRTEIPGPRSHALAERLRAIESRNITYLAPDFPIFWEQAEGCLVTDADGNTFLDMTAAFGVASIGHRHPRVVEAIHDQSEHLLHGMGDVHPSEAKVALCEQLAKIVPLPDARVILGLNGGDAIEAALKTAVLATGRSGVLAFQGGYHGLTYGALDVTSREDFRAPFLPQMGRFTSHLPYGCDLGRLEERLNTGSYGAVVAEPIQGRGGIIVPPPGWLRGLHDLCKRYGTLLVLDEIFTGWCRTGDWFACEHEGVIPDILCVGKAMGGGLPISACVASRAVMDAWEVSQGEALHTSTFLGHPLSCAAAVAAIRVMQEERMREKAVAAGAVLADGLESLRRCFPTRIAQVRGRGLMLGLAFHARDDSLALIPRALAAGLILLPAGDGSVIEFVPPLTITEAQIMWVINCLGKILDFSSPDGF